VSLVLEPGVGTGHPVCLGCGGPTWGSAINGHPWCEKRECSDRIRALSFSADWAEKAAWMREAGALSAAWHPDGTLSAVTLGPQYATTQPTPTDRPKAPDAPPMRATSRLVRGPGFVDGIEEAPR